jgi:hypothetical protein
MRKLVGSLVLALGIAFGAPLAQAVTYEDSFADCSYPKGFDLMIMRPLSLGTTVMGSALFVILTPITVITAPREFGAVSEILIRAPGRFTFRRPLGACTSVDVTY